MTTWRCYGWSGHSLPTEEARKDPSTALPGIHPRDWLIKPARYEEYDSGTAAVAWFRSLMERAQIGPEDAAIDITSDNILHGVDVSRWIQLANGRWLNWAVLTVEGSTNEHPV